MKQFLSKVHAHLRLLWPRMKSHVCLCLELHPCVPLSFGSSRTQQAIISLFKSCCRCRYAPILSEGFVAWNFWWALFYWCLLWDSVLTSMFMVALWLICLSVAHEVIILFIKRLGTFWVWSRLDFGGHLNFSICGGDPGDQGLCDESHRFACHPRPLQVRSLFLCGRKSD